MTIQQLEYVLALQRHRHFGRAAEECGVAQPTLSAMIAKLEEELEMSLFDRKRTPIAPTPAGEAFLQRAAETLVSFHGLRDSVSKHRNTVDGVLSLAVIPTIAPYLIPELIARYHELYPQVRLRVSEMRTAVAIEQLRTNAVDMAILATPLEQDDMLEIPLYYESFLGYVSPASPLFSATTLNPERLPSETLWVLKEGHCMRSQVFNICNSMDQVTPVFEAGTIDTLVKIVDANGGVTLIPSLHVPFLTEAQRLNLRPVGEEPGVREVSLMIRRDYVREQMINSVVDIVKQIIPTDMIDERLKKYRVRL